MFTQSKYPFEFSGTAKQACGATFHELALAPQKLMPLYSTLCISRKFIVFCFQPSNILKCYKHLTVFRAAQTVTAVFDGQFKLRTYFKILQSRLELLPLQITCIAKTALGLRPAHPLMTQEHTASALLDAFLFSAPFTSLRSD